MPAPDTVESAIEHAIALKQQRAKGTVQEQKAEVIKDALQEEAKVAPVSAPPPEPPKER